MHTSHFSKRIGNKDTKHIVHLRNLKSHQDFFESLIAKNTLELISLQSFREMRI